MPNVERKQHVEKVFMDVILNPINRRIINRVTKVIRVALPAVSINSYRTKVALQKYGPWALFPFKIKRDRQLHSINTTIPAGRFVDWPILSL